VFPYLLIVCCDFLCSIFLFYEINSEQFWQNTCFSSILHKAMPGKHFAPWFPDSYCSLDTFLGLETNTFFFQIETFNSMVI
jgi:hypothetical protein